MRLAVYGAASTVVGVGVVISAFNQRANFYSAAVYLAQSNACLMILTNLLVLISIVFGHGLQRLFYGPLRAIEVEQIYEKAWYAVTETCLAMTIFRDEFDVRFIIMFGALLFVKCFSWIGAGRVEFMEQQPPERPVLFHVRLASSLLLLCASCAGMVWHSVTSVLDNGKLKPNMMIMFAFEFAILLIVSTGILARYVLSLVEKWVLHKEAARRKEARLAAKEARTRELIAARAEVERRRAAGEEVDDVVEEEEEEEEDEDELDVGGWEEKGTWVFYSELCTDFLKLLTYLSFFSIVLTWYGLPLHIIRDVYITLRSFITRIRDFVRYRRATAHMNSRYPDATAEEVAHAVDCIICREGMRPWSENGAGDRAPGSQDQRTRAKKLPCGHVLHFACLRSWLERQQRCPTCRRPVLDEPPAAVANANANVNGNVNGNANPPNPAAPAPANAGFQAQFGIGPLGFDIGVGGPGMMQNFLDRMNQQNQQAVAQRAQNRAQHPQTNAGAQPPATPGANGQTQTQQSGQPATGTQSAEGANEIQNHILRTRQLLEHEARMLQYTQNQLLQLQQLQAQQAGTNGQPTTATPITAPTPTSTPTQASASATPHPPTDPHNLSQIPSLPSMASFPTTSAQGIALPPGWSLIPLTVAATVAPPAQPTSPRAHHARQESTQTNHSAREHESTGRDPIIEERIRVLREAAESMASAAAALEATLSTPSAPAPSNNQPTTITSPPRSDSPQPTNLNLFGDNSLFPLSAQDAVSRALQAESSQRQEQAQARGELVEGLLSRLNTPTPASSTPSAPEERGGEEKTDGPSREEKGKGRAVKVEDVKDQDKDEERERQRDERL